MIKMVTVFLCTCICLTISVVQAQPVVQKPARILFLLDASSSMGNSWVDSTSRFQTAGRIVNAIVDSIHRINGDVAFAVRVFGNQYPAQEKNCYDSRLEVPFNLGNDAQIKARLKYLEPRGYSPIAWSLEQTAELDFKENDHYSYSIILITDGGESCGGDICATMANLLDKKISFRPYILSLLDYAPLKMEYACMGKYITVAREKDIVPAIQTIINDNRKILTIKTRDYHPIAVTTPAPVGAKVITLPATETIVKKNIELIEEVKTPTPPPVTVKSKDADIKPKVPAADTPRMAVVSPPPVPVRKAVTPVNLIYMNRTPVKMNLIFTIPDGVAVTVPKLKVIKIPLPGWDDAPESNIASNTLKPSAENKTGAQPTQNTVASAQPKIIEPTTVVKKTSEKKVTKVESKDAINLPFEEKVVDAKESSIQVYFTDGKGKFYKTEPKLVIKKSALKAEVKSVYRNLEGGEPSPITLDPGTYDIAITGSRANVKGVVVEPGKTKKVYVVVGRGSLEFYYPTAPNRPVKEYTAHVSKRFEPGPVVTQACDTSLPYEPANYHIEINTLPEMMLNVDLDFYSIKVMSIPEAGTLQITNTNKKGIVQFWCQRGDAFVLFHEMNVNGNVESQKVDFLPGLYQVRYFNEPKTALSKANVVMFRVKSNMVTSIELQ